MPKIQITLQQWSAIVTWAIVSGFSLYIVYVSDKFDTFHIVVSTLLCCLFIILWLVLTSDDVFTHTQKTRFILLAALFINIIGIYFFIPAAFVAIFMVIFSSCLLYFVSFKTALILSPFLAIPLILIYTFHWGYNDMIMTGFLFWTFNLFGLVMVHTSVKEREARLEAELASRQLKATQGLLNEAVKQGERVRIARNIHDLLGHHLTALTINLQVAARKSNGESKESIEQCHQLAKLLLSDVREAVSDIRDKSKIDLQTSIQDMLVNLPNLNVEMTLEPHLKIDDIQVADAIIKSIQETITNTIKHAKGDTININISSANQDNNQSSQLNIEISSNGKLPENVVIGNGLTGIKERFLALGGSASFTIKNTLFYTHLTVPVAEND